MTRIVDVAKRSKKDQKAFYDAQRGSWNGVRHCGTVFTDRKKYRKSDRSRQKAMLRAGI